MSKCVYQPESDFVKNSFMTKLENFIKNSYNIKINSYKDLHDFSIKETEKFWKAIVEESNIKLRKKPDVFKIENKGSVEKAVFFKNVELNLTENLLVKNNEDIAIHYKIEDKISGSLTWKDLNKKVSIMQQFLLSKNISKGDVIAGFLPNCPEAIIAMLASQSLGAIWTSCSPDFGVDGVLDRFSQTKPKILFSCDKYSYKGKWHHILQKVDEIKKKIPSIQYTVINFYNQKNDLNNYINWNTITEKYKASEKIEYTSMNFNDPAFILYSSGTTGAPKCIVHSVGGSVFNLKKEGRYHSNIGEKDNVFFFTTCGWMMWNWLIGQLSNGATLLLYDGSPFYPKEDILLDYLEEKEATFFGNSAKYYSYLEKINYKPQKKLKKIKTIASTGSILEEETFTYINDEITENAHIMSMSGGTDILGCFLIGNPNMKVFAGELTVKCLASDIAIFDDDGKNILNGVGELVCKNAMVNMPVYFFNDMDGKKYHKAYFDVYENVWHHGDYVEISARETFLIKGRSDSVLNPGGVRIGSSEIYRCVNKLDFVDDSIVIGQNFDNDVRLILFVQTVNNIDLNEQLRKKIINSLRTECSPKHVPFYIFKVLDIPKTFSGKMSETAVKDIMHNKDPKNISAIKNKQSLQEYRKIYNNINNLS